MKSEEDLAHHSLGGTAGASLSESIMERVFDEVKERITNPGHPPEFSRIGEAKKPGPTDAAADEEG